MALLPMKEIRPSYLPPGFSFRTVIDGPAGGGFIPEVKQTAVVHARGSAVADRPFPLTVFVALDREQELIGTHGRAGVSLNLASSTVASAAAVERAEYHDGIWHLDTALADAIGYENALRWHPGAVHSATIRTATRVYAVRGPRDVALDSLLGVLTSLPLK
jgi:hypothetical protein